MNRKIFKLTFLLLGLLILLPSTALAETFEPIRIKPGKFRGLRAGSFLVNWSLGSRIGLNKTADHAAAIGGEFDYHLSGKFAFNFGLQIGFGRDTVPSYNQNVGFLTFNVDGFFGVKFVFRPQGPFVPYALAGLHVGYFTNGTVSFKSFTFGARLGGGVTYYFKRRFGLGLKVLFFPCGYYGSQSSTGLYFPMDIMAVASYKFR